MRYIDNRGGDESGFGLIELIFGLVILAIGLLALASLSATSIKASAYARSVTQATNITQDRTEALLSIPYKNVYLSEAAGREDLKRVCTAAGGGSYNCVPNGNPPTITMDGKTYTWSYTVTIMDLNGDGVANATKDALLMIAVTVSWQDAMFRGTKSITTTTMRTRD